MNDNSNDSSRNKLIRIFLGAVFTAGLIWLSYYLLVSRWHQDTDDAYVAGDVFTITSEVGGTVHKVNVDDTESVRAGQVLVELDSRDSDLEVASAEAMLARAVRNVRSLQEQSRAATDEVALRQVELARLEQDYNRRQPLKSDGAVASEELAHLTQGVESARKALAAAEAKASSLKVVANGNLVTHPEVEQAIAHLKAAGLASDRSRIVAPVDGVVAKRSVHVGSRLMPGAPLMAVVPLNQVWIDANFREVDLRDVHIGQPATVVADLYGNNVVYHGKVAGLSAGTGSAFSLLPAQNASGNWIKIVQRLPVRILIDADDLKAHPLRIGLSTRVSIDVHDQSGPLVTENARLGIPQPEAASSSAAKWDARIQAIIAANQMVSAKK